MSTRALIFYTHKYSMFRDGYPTIQWCRLLHPERRNPDTYQCVQGTDIVTSNGCVQYLYQISAMVGVPGPRDLEFFLAPGPDILGCAGARAQISLHVLVSPGPRYLNMQWLLLGFKYPTMCWFGQIQCEYPNMC
jgi:hypothetical protein